jgi:hypothetical protein
MSKGIKVLIYLGVLGATVYFARRVFAGEVGVPSPPSAPPSVGTPNVTGPDTAEVDVSWDPVPGATYYQVFVNGQYAVQVQETKVKLTNLRPGQTYSIAIAACN